MVFILGKRNDCCVKLNSDLFWQRCRFDWRNDMHATLFVDEPNVDLFNCWISDLFFCWLLKKNHWKNYFPLVASWLFSLQHLCTLISIWVWMIFYTSFGYQDYTGWCIRNCINEKTTIVWVEDAPAYYSGLCKNSYMKQSVSDFIPFNEYFHFFVSAEFHNYFIFSRKYW